MPKNIITTVYTFDELDGDAKEKAREWYREGAFEYDWWDGVYENVADAAGCLGINLRQKPVKLMNGKTRYDPEIYFRGFYHQGQGSGFSGTWKASEVKAEELKKEFPSDKELHRMADGFAELAKENPELSCSIRSERDTSISVNSFFHGEERDNIIGELKYESPEWERETSKDQAREDTLAELLRDFNTWIFVSLRNEYDYLNSDEQVDESILANEYTFTKDGKRF